MAINLRPGCKGVIIAGLIPVGASWGQPVEPEVLEDLNERQAQQARMIYWVGGVSGAALLISLGWVVLRWRLGTVQARRFVLRDGRRHVMAQLAPSYNGSELELHDAKGEIAAVLGDGLRLRTSFRVRADGMTLLKMNDQNGRARTMVGVLDEGLAWVGLLDEQQRFRAGLGTRRDGRRRLDLYDAEGETRASLHLDDRGRPKFDLDQ
jgi:hypothetical protein